MNTKSLVLSCLLLFGAFFVSDLVAAEKTCPANGKLKIFIVSGQSNMVGFGQVEGETGTMESYVKSNPKAYGHLVNKEGKPVGIMSHIGQRPIFAGGNSDGDFQMMEWTSAGDGPRFGLLIHHTDGEREFAYDREGHIGVLSRGLEDAEAQGWTIVDMANDWSRVWTGTK